MPSRYDRRRFLRSAALVGALGAAGCVSSPGQSTDDEPAETATESPTQTPSDTPTETAQETTEPEEPTEEDADETESRIEPLTADGSSTVYPIANEAAAYWNANRPASDREYWPHAEYGIDTDHNYADYWAARYGFEPTGESSEPPLQMAVGLSHSERGLEGLADGRVDIGNASAAVETELRDRASYENFTDHVVAVDGIPIVVSQDVADAGVSSLTGEQLRDLYTGRIENWRELGGPDREVAVLGRAGGSGTRTAFVSALFGDPAAETTVDDRYDQNQQLATAVERSDSAIAYLALALADFDGVSPIALEWEGTTYEYGRNLGARGYPLSRDLHCYTWDGTSPKEAAFLDSILSEFGQDRFVAGNDYVPLPDDRLGTQRDRSPDRA
ncbi:PstS family phosphate ABC transporter substrate-binding protein [Halorientalis pallida]|uniref:Phosphate ABC transporter substrate-binding protein n=1 Tax=Halorientalis pallida TaxID=2479928 RepID=A0A498KZQ4_9EURY|nr:substrate-binding domain-containing protein [Halorientalis pallida]RXK50063.1 phosphate ABC transporter substrate-binding protein [Halorientalis pallida]